MAGAPPRRRPLAWLDVFTATPLAGNGLAVVHDAGDLDDATMLAFARETRLSETTFVQPPTEPGADYRNRIWATGGEMRFAGHPSLGTAVAVARARGEEHAALVQQTIAGLQPVEVAWRDERRARASMLQEPAELGEEHDPAPLLAAVGLPPDAAHPELPFQTVSTGTPHVMAPLRDRAALAAVAPDARALGAALAPLQVLYLAVVDVPAGTARARGLLVEPDGVIEDPATGSAAGPLLAYLRVRRGIGALTVEQGREMGRPSRLETAAEGDRIRVTGECVLVAEGHAWL